MSEKKKAPKRYYILGDQALSFSDPLSGLIIRSKKEVVEISVKYVRNSERVKAAVTGGHIKLVDGPPDGMNLTKLPLQEVKQKSKIKTIPGVVNLTGKKAKVKKVEEEEEEETEEEEEEQHDMTKAELVEAIEGHEDVTDEQKEGLGKMKKAELQELLAELNGE